MRYTVAFKLNGSLAAAAAVEWTDAQAPRDSAAGWEACVRRANGDWRFSSHDIAPEAQRHWRGPGLFGNIGLRYRLTAAGPWSPISAGRKEITLIEVTDAIPDAPPALTAEQWSAPEAHDLGGGVFTAAFALAGAAAAAQAVEWALVAAGDAAVADGGWELCVPLGDGRWRLGGSGTGRGHEILPGGALEGIALRYRLGPDGLWSPVSQDRKALAIAPPAPVLIAPLLVAAPLLSGTGKIGSEVTVTAGLWTGMPAPDLTLQWRRDGVEIPQAVQAGYVPGPEDDRCELSCSVTASSTAGSAAATAGPLRVTHVAPTAAGALVEEIFDQGSGVQTVAAAGDFTGAALTFAVAGAGAGIDAASGMVRIPTDAVLSGETVTVTATNSGGSAASAFQVTVEAAEVEIAPPPALAADQWRIVYGEDAAVPDAKLVMMFKITDAAHPAWNATRLYWSGQDAPGAVTHGALGQTVRHPNWDRSGDPFERAWIQRNVGGGTSSWHDRSLEAPGTPYAMILRYTTDAWSTAAADAEYSPDSAPVTTRIPGPVLPAPVGDYLRAPYHTAAKAAVGYPPSDNEQVILTMARSLSEPDRIYAGQDVGGVWVSINNGRKWNTLRNRGLGTPHIYSIEVDPVDADRVIALVGRRGYVADSAERGIYRSLDGGLNWARALPWDDISEPRGALSRIAYAPSSAGANFAARWYAAFDGATLSGSASVRSVDGLVTSSDGGAAWTRVRALPEATFGTTIRGCRVSPANASVLYLWGSGGLFRINDASGSGNSVNKMSGSGGLPARSVYGDLHISPNGRTLIVGVSGDGVWKSVDAGGAWTRLYAWSALLGCFVNAAFPDQIYAVSGDANQCRVSNNGGSSWITNVKSEPMPGANSGAYQTYIGNNEPLVLPDPRDKGRASAFANSKFFQTDDGGSNWRPATDFYCGVHHKNYAAPQIFDPSNPQRYVIGCLDAGVFTTTDGGRTLRNSDVKKKLGAQIEWASVNGIALHPGGQIILACAGRETRGRLIRSTNFGETWSVADSVGDANPSAEPARHWIGFDAGDPDYAYQWRRRSANAGAGWTTLGKMPADAVIIGVSRTAHNGRSVLYACRPKPSRNPSPIWMSLDRGEAWIQIADPNWDLCSDTDQQVTFRVHPTNPFKLYTRNAQRQIREWTVNASGAAVAVRDFDVFGGGKKPANFDASNFCVDPQNPEVMYLRNSRAVNYDGNFLFRSEDAGKTWTNISEGFSNSGGNGMEVHPATGVLYLGTTNGMYCRKPPYPVPTGNNTYDLLSAAYPGWGACHINAAY